MKTVAGSYSIRYVFSEITALTIRELKKWVRNPVVVIMMMIQPVLWIGLFGKAFNLTGLFQIPPEALANLPPEATQQFQELFNQIMTRTFGASGIDYFSYMALGMPSVIVLFASLSSGMSLSWERRFGFLNKLLVAPISRASIIISKVLGGTVKAIVQATVILLIAVPLGLKLDIAGWWQAIAVVLGLVLLAVGISMLIISLSLRTKSWEQQMAVMNLLNLPIMFTSNVLIPTSMMPTWLQKIASVNPLSYSADLTRQALLMGASADAHQILVDLGVLSLTALIMLVLGVIGASKVLRKE